MSLDEMVRLLDRQFGVLEAKINEKEDRMFARLVERFIRSDEGALRKEIDNIKEDVRRLTGLAKALEDADDADLLSAVMKIMRRWDFEDEDVDVAKDIINAVRAHDSKYGEN